MEKMPKFTPAAAWENGLKEARERLQALLERPMNTEDLKRIPERLDARDRGALAYILWRLRNATECDEAEPVRAPGRMTDERRAALTPEEKIFFGIED